HQLVRADGGAGALGARRVSDGGGWGTGRGFEEPLGLGIRGQQFLDLSPQLLVGAARLVKILRALGGRLQGQRRREQRLGVRVRFGHRPAPLQRSALFKKRKRRPARLTGGADFFTPRRRGSRGSWRSTARSWRNASSGPRSPARSPADRR